MTDSGNGAVRHAGSATAARLAGVAALLGELRFTADDGDRLVEATVDGAGEAVAVVLTNRAARMLSEEALGARIVAALDRARAPAAEAAGAVLVERLGAAPVEPLPAAAGQDRAGEGELAVVETAHDATGTVTATVNALGELYEIRLARDVLELHRGRLASRIAEAEQAAYHAALRAWADRQPLRPGLRRSG